MIHDFYDFDVKCPKCKSTSFQRIHRTKLEKVRGKRKKFRCKECGKAFFS